MSTIHAKQTSPLRVLVLGGGYGGLAAGLNLLDLCNGKVARFNQSYEKHVEGRPQFPIRVKFVDERDGYYHVIGSPLSLCDKEFAPKAWQRYADLPAFRAPEISFSQGSAVNIDAEKMMATLKNGITGKTYEEPYDYLIAATGLRRNFPSVPRSLTKDNYLVEAGKHIDLVRNAKEGVVVIGGGAVGIEMAGEIATVHPTQTITLIHSRPKLLSTEPLSDEFKGKTAELLRKTGVRVILNQRVTNSTPMKTEDSSPSYLLTLSNGTTIKAGHVIYAISNQTPITSFLPSSSLSEEGYVKVGASMQFLPHIPNYEFHYAVGDIISWSGIKRCGAAMSQGYHAAHNIHQQLLLTLPPSRSSLEMELKLFPEVPPMIAIAIGKTAIMFSPNDGMTFGKDVLKMMFRDDIGFAICWEYLQLGIDPTAAISLGTINEKEEKVEVVATAAKMEAIAV